MTLAKDTNIYNFGKGETIAYKAILAHRTNPAQACGGFAAMLSDYVFGASSNPVRKLDDNTQVRPGDIVIHFNSKGTVSHVEIAMTTIGTTNRGNPGIKPTGGNVGGVVQWGDADRNYGSYVAPTTIVYTRYPA